jgi:MFS family permease
VPALRAGIAAFVLGVLVAGTAPGMAVLVAGRALQGFGAGLVSVALYVVVAQAYPSALHPRIFSAFAAAWVVPVIVGPALAALLAAQLGWRWVFLAAAVLVVPATLLLQHGLAQLPPHRAASAPLRVSIARPGPWVALACALSAGLLYAGAQTSAPGALLMALALIGIAFSAPRLLPSGSLSGKPGLPTVIALRGLAAAAFFAGEVLIPLLLISERGLSVLQAGLVLTVGALGWSAGSWFQGRRSMRRDDDTRVRTLRIGMAAITLGTLAVPAVLLPGVPVALAALAWTISGLGIGLVFPTLSVETLEFAPKDEQGAASAALQLSDGLMSAVGLAGASTLLALLLPWSTGGAYLAGFGTAAALALLGVALASRARPPAR